MRLKFPFFLNNLNEEPYHKPRNIFNFKYLKFLFFISLVCSILFISNEFSIFSFKTFIDRVANKIVAIENRTKLKEIHVIGRENISKPMLIKTLGLTNETSLIGINITLLNKKINSINWVKTAVIERRMPHTLIIKIEEYEPFALLQVQDGHIIISSEGKKIIKDNGKFNYLPVINGTDSDKNAAKMLDILSSEPSLFHQVWAISYIGKRRWDISLRSGIKVKLPEKNPSEAWTRLSEIDRSQSILSREIDIIDLRKPGHLILTPAKIINIERST